MSTEPKTTPAPYCRRAFYYETDQMSIVHHSNYIRWMEEARLDYMAQAGVRYADMEAAGVIMPVVSVNCRYITSVHYDETVRIEVRLSAFNGVRTAFSYRMLREDGSLAATGESTHCYLDSATRRPVRLQHRLPALYEQCNQLLKEQNS